MNHPLPMHEQHSSSTTSPRPSRLAQLGKLSRTQQRTMVAAWLWLPLFWIGLRTFGFDRFQSRLQRKPITARQPSSMQQNDVLALAEAVNIAARHTPFHATCLTRSLLACWLIRRRGVSSELRIGVNLSSGTLKAHAWVEYAGQPVNDRADIADEFRPFASPPAETAFIAS